MVALALRAGCLIQHVEVYDGLLFQPFLGLVDDDCLTLGHLDCHATASLLVKEFALCLVELLCHRGGNCVLIHEEVIPVGLVVEVGLQNLLFLLLVVSLRSISIKVSFVSLLLLFNFLSAFLLVFVLWMVGRVLKRLLGRGRRLPLSWLDVKLAALEIGLVELSKGLDG